MLNALKNFVRKYLTVKVVAAVETPVYRERLLEGKRALVIGGAGGVGSAIVKSFVDAGCKVVATGTNEAKLRALCERIGSESTKSVVLDTTNVAAIEPAIERAASFFGAFDVFVYCAGTHCRDRFGEVSEATWDAVLDVNLKGMYFACQAIAKHMIANGVKGHILTVGSASCAKPGWTPYEISKNAVRALTLGFADKLIGRGIVVNSIAPGPVATPMLGATNDNLAWEGNPTGRMCAPEEIANVALTMVSSLGDMIVGDTFFVSGGSGTICLDR